MRPSNGPVTAANEKTAGVNSRTAFALAASLFPAWGFLTALNDVLVPYMKDLFQLNYVQAMLVPFVSYLCYLLVAQPAGRLVNTIGYKKTMTSGLLIMGFGAFCIVLASFVPIYGIFLAALMTIGG